MQCTSPTLQGSSKAREANGSRMSMTALTILPSAQAVLKVMYHPTCRRVCVTRVCNAMLSSLCKLLLWPKKHQDCHLRYEKIMQMRFILCYDMHDRA